MFLLFHSIDRLGYIVFFFIQPLFLVRIQYVLPGMLRIKLTIAFSVPIQNIMIENNFFLVIFLGLDPVKELIRMSFFSFLPLQILVP